MQKFAYVSTSSTSASSSKTDNTNTGKGSTVSRRRGSTKQSDDTAPTERSSTRRGRPLSSERTTVVPSVEPTSTSSSSTIVSSSSFSSSSSLTTATINSTPKTTTASKRSKVSNTNVKNESAAVKLEYDIPPATVTMKGGVPQVMEPTVLLQSTGTTRKSTKSTTVLSSTIAAAKDNTGAKPATLAATLESFNHSLVRPNQSALFSSLSSSTGGVHSSSSSSSSMVVPSSPVRSTNKSSSSSSSSSSSTDFPEAQQPPNSPSRGYGTPRKPHPKWEEQLHNILKMRAKKTAPVDSMGCERCADPNAEPRIQRFQTLLSLLLSSQTKDPITYAATQRLIQFGCTPEKLAVTDTATIEKLIYPAGFHHKKAEYIKAVAETCIKDYGGDIPQDIPSLCSLKGIGPKMAFIAMNAAWGKPVGIGVDTHVHRICNTLGWVKTSSPEQTRDHLQSWLPREYWSGLNVALVGFGQEICLSRGAKCEECLNRFICPGSTAKGGKKQYDLMNGSENTKEDVNDW